MKLTKLDSYDYAVLPGVISIKLDSKNDPIMVDILAEINRSNGKIYVEGGYYQFLNQHRVYTDVVKNESYLELLVD